LYQFVVEQVFEIGYHFGNVLFTRQGEQFDIDLSEYLLFTDLVFLLNTRVFNASPDDFGKFKAFVHLGQFGDRGFDAIRDKVDDSVLHCVGAKGTRERNTLDNFEYRVGIHIVLFFVFCLWGLLIATEKNLA
jgi:formylmethanofuran:tetrahydromethanopterin formyltransferase